MAGYLLPTPIWTDFRQLGTSQEIAITSPYANPYDLSADMTASKFTRDTIYGGQQPAALERCRWLD